jgi:RNA polymerase sigma factor (sigma-70 family)
MAVAIHREPGETRGSRRSRPSRPAERRLVLAAKHGPGPDRERLIESLTPLIAIIARTYRTSSGIERAELMQEGVVGVLRALDRFDPSLETPFWPYASWWVRQAMQQVVAQLSRPVVLSDRAARELARVKEARTRHAREHGHDPTPCDLGAGSEERAASA